MDEKRKEIIDSLLDIIHDFRCEELDFRMDRSHIEKWLEQFDSRYQDVILQETVTIFQDWYCNRERILDFIKDVLRCLKERYGYETDAELFGNVSFPSCSLKGMSQVQILQMLADYSVETAQRMMLQCTNTSVSHFVYIDDGIYTGKTALKEIASLLELLPENSTLDAFFIFGCTNGINYANKMLKQSAADKKVKLSILRWKNLANNKRSHRSEDGLTVEIEPHRCLWPYVSLKGLPEISAFGRDYISSSKVHEFHPYREDDWMTDKGVFTNHLNRNIVEREFLLKGIELTKYRKEDSGMLPLGFDSWPSFGLGSFCATDLNISNTAPLVRWWGNIKKDGSVLDNWYPLLPRRIGGIEAVFDSEIYDYWDYEDDTDSQDGYNTCPDCGRKISSENDGGNGFCCFCAWNH